MGDNMNKVSEFNERKFIYILKALALFSIVTAHVGTITNNTPISIIYSLILSSIGSIGVGLFFLISGYLFSKSNKSFRIFSKTKLTTIIIPWFFCGTILFLYVALRKGDLNLYNWFITITVHSHLYFLSVLMVFYFIFWRLKNNLYFLLYNIGLSIISISLTGLGWVPIYPYINPFNWSIYFILGMLIKKYDLLEKIAVFCKKWFLYISGIYALIFIIYLFNGVAITYWKYASIIAELAAIAFVFGVAFYCLNFQKVNSIVYIGKMSFSIYLLHTAFAGIFTNIFSRFNLWYLSILIPFIVIILTIAGIEFGRWISRKIKVNRILDLLIGVRM